jgi:Na+-driven multidrug efflux pump
VVISTYSIGNRLIGFFMMPAMGISNALASVIGQNLGADKIDRAEKSVSVAMKLVMAIMTTGCLIMFFFGAYLTKFFIDDPAVIEAGKRMFRIVAVAANIFGIMFVFMGVFNGSGHTKPAMLVNISRLWFFRIPLTYMLSGYLLNFSFFQSDIFVAIISKLSAPLSEHPYDALWWAMLISNILASTWAYLIYRKGRWKKARIHSD